MKKFIVLTVAALAIGALLVPSAFAENIDYGDWYDQMFQWHYQWIDDAEENGQINEQQAEAWKDHFGYMQEFHNQYPMGMMMGGYGYGPMGGYGGNGNMNGAPNNANPAYGMGGGYGNMMGGYGQGASY